MRGVSCRLLMMFAVLAAAAAALPSQAAVRIKDLARFEGVRDNAILGYGLVVGLPGQVTHNVICRLCSRCRTCSRSFGLNVPPVGVSSRNVAAVLVTASLPGVLRIGDKLDVNVSSIGDARSLAVGLCYTLRCSEVTGASTQPRRGARGRRYRFEQNGNVEQKNFPTSGTIPEGAVAEKSCLRS